MVRSAEMKYCFHYGGRGNREELFDLVKDPDETTNLADNPKYAERKAKIRQVLAQQMRETADPALAHLIRSRLR